MKKARMWIFLLTGVLVLSVVTIGWFAMKTNSDFATEAMLEYHYIGKDISVKITDENDILALKQVFNGHPFADSPSCGFTTDISVTMTNGSKSIVFCPACDGCPLLRIGDSGKYLKISDEDRTRMNTVLEKYGMIFPCV